MWIGLNDLENEGFWQYYDGTTCGDDEGISCDATGLPYWLEGQPNNIYNDQHCGRISPARGIDGGLFDDFHCNYTEHYLCEESGYRLIDEFYTFLLHQAKSIQPLIVSF